MTEKPFRSGHSGFSNFRLRSAVGAVPGTFVAYKILKNLRYRLPLRRPTTAGGIKHGGMDQAAALAYVRDIFGKIDEAVRQTGGWAGRNVLEIGPGDSLGCGLLAIAKGAEKYCAIDRFSVRFDPESERRIFLDLIGDLSDDERGRVDAMIDILPNGYRADPDRFEYFDATGIEESCDLFPEATFDVVFSNAVLEHVADVPASLTAIRALMRPGGVMFHDVDLRSHQRIEKHPMQILEYPNWLWRAMSSHSGEPNRVRLPEYLRIVRELGFADVHIDVRQRFDPALIDRVRPRLARLFRAIADQDLSVAVFQLEASLPT